MTYIPRPKPCFLDRMEKLGYRHGRLRWRSPDHKRLYTWDGLHGEIEVFNQRGVHLGSIDAKTGITIKNEDKTKRIDV
jgi:hypothetical protein